MDKQMLNVYFAGLIDGEGCVNVYRHGKRNIPRPVIKVDMTSFNTIKALHNHFGGYLGKKKVEDKPNRKQQWRWEVTFKKAIGVAKQIEPYLIEKKIAAQNIIKYEKPLR